jgi:hypothetical protein
MQQRCVTPNCTRATYARPNLLLSLRATLFPVGLSNRRDIGWIAFTAERIDADRIFFGPGVFAIIPKKSAY